jgi:hypothetical protein
MGIADNGTMVKVSEHFAKLNKLTVIPSFVHTAVCSSVSNEAGFYTVLLYKCFYFLFLLYSTPVLF